jgi:hypothetical protein
MGYRVGDLHSISPCGVRGRVVGGGVLVSQSGNRSIVFWVCKTSLLPELLVVMSGQ